MIKIFEQESAEETETRTAGLANFCILLRCLRSLLFNLLPLSLCSLCFLLFKSYMTRLP